MGCERNLEHVVRSIGSLGAALLALVAVSPASALDIQAHRGGAFVNGKASYPENTLPAFAASARRGFTLELDVHLTKDRVPIVIHDPTLNRTTTCTGSVAAKSFATIRRRCRSDILGSPGSELGSRRTSGRVPLPSLAEVLALARRRHVKVSAEISNYPGNPGYDRNVDRLAARIARVIKASKLPLSSVIVQSFTPENLLAIRRQLPKVATSALSLSGGNDVRLDVAATVDHANWISPQWPVDAAYVDRAHGRGLKVVPFTLDKAADVVAARAAGVDALITDDPAMARRALAPRSLRANDIAADGSCAGSPITPTSVITGTFGSQLQGSYVMVPVDVPAGTTALRVKYCYSQPAGPTTANAKNTLDLGLWDPSGFRGWGGSSHPDVSVSRRGFSGEAQYLAAPTADVPGMTTRGFVPGPVPAGRWQVELGVGGVLTPEQGNPSGSVDWRLEIAALTDPAFAAPVYAPATYDAKPARRAARWYVGDLHVHAEHSDLGAATMRQTFDYAFRPRSRGGAGLDFITLTDYVTTSAWGEIGRFQPDYPGKLVIRSAEVITYRGHTNNQASHTYVDHRLGPVYERAADGSLKLVRAARAPKEVFDAVHAAGGWTQINHPRIFPPAENPVFALLCRGCAWLYSDSETNFRKVDAIEVGTGPATQGPATAPETFSFTKEAIAYYQHALATGAHVAAVAVSDSHHAGMPLSATQTPIGRGATAVFARELSERGIAAAVRAGHTYAKLLGAQGPDLRLTASRGTRRAIMGDTIGGGRRVRFAATVSGATARATPGAGRYALLVQRNGRTFRRIVLRDPRATFLFRASRPGRWGLVLMHGKATAAVTTPIWVRP